MKLVLLEWDPMARIYRSLRFFEYNDVEYPPGTVIPITTVWIMERDKEHKRELINEIEESIKYEKWGRTGVEPKK